MIGCINGAGQATPPFVIFDVKSLNMEWTNGEATEEPSVSPGEFELSSSSTDTECC